MGLRILKNKKVIGSWCICNSASLNVYDVIYDIDNKLLVGLNYEKPTKRIINTDENDRNYINFGGLRYYLDECIKIQ